MPVDRLAFAQMRPPASPELVPLQRIATAVLHQAIDDLRRGQPRRRVTAEAFVRSGEFDYWCGVTTLDPEAVRERLCRSGLIFLTLDEG